MNINASYAPNGTPIGEGSGVVYISPDIHSSASLSKVDTNDFPTVQGLLYIRNNYQFVG
jgi:hypothetical protein